MAKFLYRIEPRPGKKHSNVDGLSRRRAEGCKQCLNIERRDGGPPCSNVKDLIGKAGVYSWKEGQIRSEPPLKLSPTFMHTLHHSGTSGSCVGFKLHYLGW